MTDDTRWRVDGVEVEGLISEQPTWTVGESISLEFKIGEESIAGRPTPDHALEAALGGRMGATMGGDKPGTLNAHLRPTEDGVRPRDEVYFTKEDTPFGDLQSLTRYAGSATTEMSVDGVPLIRETIPARSDRETFVIKIEPIGSDVAWTSGAWVLVTNATDTSIVADRDAWLAIEVEAHVLAPLTEYNTLAELEADMAPPVISD